MTSWRWIAAAIVVGCVVAGVVGLASVNRATVSAQASTRVFELRTYTANPGKFEAMKARFRITSFRCSRSTISPSSASGRMPIRRRPRHARLHPRARESRGGQEELGGVHRGSGPEAGVGGHRKRRADQHESRVRLPESDGVLAREVVDCPGDSSSAVAAATIRPGAKRASSRGSIRSPLEGFAGAGVPSGGTVTPGLYPCRGQRHPVSQIPGGLRIHGAEVLRCESSLRS